MLFFIVGYVAWFVFSLVDLVRIPVTHSATSSIDHRWASLVQPALFAPTIVVFAYLNWLGWKFFQHN